MSDQQIGSAFYKTVNALGTQMKVKVLVLKKLAFLIDTQVSYNLQSDSRPPNTRLAV